MSDSKKKECFVLMPLEDFCYGYKYGHFRKVYDEIIRPAVIKAGYQPVRGDEVENDDEMHLEIIQKIINAPMLVCDLSSLNRKISLGLRLRKISRKPAVIIKDKQTPNVVHIDTGECMAYVENYESEDAKSSKNELLHSLQKIKHCVK